MLWRAAIQSRPVRSGAVYQSNALVASSDERAGLRVGLVVSGVVVPLHAAVRVRHDFAGRRGFLMNPSVFPLASVSRLSHLGKITSALTSDNLGATLFIL
jgi:hypothetical protein